MQKNYIISCESTTDLPFEYFEKRGVPIAFYKFTIDQKEYEDNMERNNDVNKFFSYELSKGKIPLTSQINEYSYYEYFSSIIKDDIKILHIAFSSGLTSSVNNAIKAAERINADLGEERITVIDSTCGSSGYGMLVCYALDLKEQGCSLTEVIEHIEQIKYNINHEFFSSDMKFFKHSGRLNGPTATIASILGICALMNVDKSGKLVAYGKTRGKKNALLHLLDVMSKKADGKKSYSGKCFISHTNCFEDANFLKEKIESEFHNLKGKVMIFNIGNIIASHCGQGTVALFFVGEKRQ